MAGDASSRNPTHANNVFQTNVWKTRHGISYLVNVTLYRITNLTLDYRLMTEHRTISVIVCRRPRFSALPRQVFGFRFIYHDRCTMFIVCSTRDYYTQKSIVSTDLASGNNADNRLIDKCLKAADLFAGTNNRKSKTFYHCKLILAEYFDWEKNTAQIFSQRRNLK